MPTLVAVAIRIIANPLANVYQKKLVSTKGSAVTVSFLTYALLSLGVVVLIPEGRWHSLRAEFWETALLAGIFGAAGNAFLVRALQSGELSVLGPINAYKPVVSLIAGFFILREIPGWLGCAGMAFVLWGSYFIIAPETRTGAAGILRRIDLRYRIGALVLTAAEAVLLKKIILLSSPRTAFIVWCWAGALCSLPMLLLSRPAPFKSHFQIGRREMPKYLLLVLCIGIMQYTTNFVFDRMPVAAALSLFQLSALLSVFLGAHFFRERDIVRKLTGAGIMITGAILIIVSGN